MRSRATFVLISIVVWFLVFGCSAELPNRQNIISGAQEIAKCPDFVSSCGGGGSTSGSGHYFYQGSFLVKFADYRTKDGGKIDQESFLWEVFKRYGEFVKEHINYDLIPNMIAKGGSSENDPKATRHDFMFVSTDVTIGYEVEWFRGGPGDWENPNPEVQVIFHIRIN
jgi:hypothetical protein